MSERRIQTDKEIFYRMCVAGAFAGLITWFAGVWLPFLITLPESDPHITKLLNPSLVTLLLGVMPKNDYWIVEVIDSSLIGLFISAFYVLFAWRLSREGVNRSRALGRILVGALAGCLAGVLSVIFSFRLRGLLPGEWPRAGILVTWCLTGALVGLVSGLIRYRWLVRYVSRSLFGGLVGACIGGCLLLAGGEFVPHFRSVGLMVTGLSICLCSSLAVKLARHATLRYVGSADPTTDKMLRGREWDLLENVTYVFGRNGFGGGPSYGRFYIQVGDPQMAPIHASIEWEKERCWLSVYRDNRDPHERPIRTLDAGSPPSMVRGQQELRDKDEILMGQTCFAFLLRRKGAALVLCLLAGALGARDASAQAKGTQLVMPEGIQMLRVQGGSETIAFRVPLNVVDASGQPQKISAFNPEQIENGARVFEGASRLKVCHVGFGSLPRRYAILLVDVSGSMREKVGGAFSKSKFEVMKEACRKFTGDFVPGVDYVAVIPFHSHRVVEGVREAEFFNDQKKLEEHISKIEEPEPRNNTALFSAMRAALDRLKDARDEHGVNAQYLLIVLTDGKNDVHAGDDKDLEVSPDGVVAFKNSLKIPIITVGFGNDQNLNPSDLRSLARPEDSYRRARNPEDLVATFQQARSLQLDRLRLIFLPQPNLLSQLVSPHTYRLQLQLENGDIAEGLITWNPRNINIPQGTLTPEESACFSASSRPDWLRPVLIFLFLSGGLLFMWVRPPTWIRRSWQNEELELAWMPRVSALGKQLWKP
jgi:hypothetical protein